MSEQLRVDLSHTPSPFSRRNKLGRVAWAVVYWTLFRFSPKSASSWRRFLLRLFGARLTDTSKVAASVRVWAPWNLKMGEFASMAHSVDCYNQGPIIIGDHTAISQYAHLCASTHDYTRPNLPLIAYRIEIGSGVWICTDVFVGPHVRIGDGTVVGARSSVFRDLPPWKVCVGNPAVPIKDRILQKPDPLS